MRIRANSRPDRGTPISRLGTLVVVAAVTVLGLSVVTVTGAATMTSAGAASITTSRAAPTPATLTASSNPALTVPAYWTVASDGGVFTFGGAPFFGSEGGSHLNAPVVGMAATSDGGGYWLVASDGGIFSFGDAGFFGSEGGAPLNQPIVSMAATPDGGGYWLVAADGGIFTFGDANFYGSEGSAPLTAPIVGMAATTDGLGYYLVAADGGVFNFGDAVSYGSMAGSTLNAPVVGMTVTPGSGNTDTGYMLVAADGGIFGFGAINYFGSEGGAHLNKPVVGIASTPREQGYWEVATDGGIFTFGNAGFYGSMGGQTLNSPMVGVAETFGNGTVADPPPPPPPPTTAPSTVLTSGTSGYDVSVFNCGNLPPAGGVDIVQVTGASMSATNSCLAQEAAWAGSGLNLYIFLTFGTSNSSSLCNGNVNVYYCYGYQTGQYAFGQAQAAGVATDVNWWLDVESTSGTGLPAWSPTTLQNDQLIQGAHDGLAAAGAGNVGVYASPGSGWPQIAGNWPIDYPYWMATWTTSGPNSCATVAGWQQKTVGLPTGGVPMVQWSDNVFNVSTGAVDGDYVC